MTTNALGIEHTPLTLGSWPCSPQSCLYKTSHQPLHPHSWAPGLHSLTSHRAWAMVRSQKGPCLMLGVRRQVGQGPPQPPAPGCNSQGLALGKPSSSGKPSQISPSPKPAKLPPPREDMNENTSHWLVSFKFSFNGPRCSASQMSRSGRRSLSLRSASVEGGRPPTPRKLGSRRRRVVCILKAGPERWALGGQRASAPLGLDCRQGRDPEGGAEGLSPWPLPAAIAVGGGRGSPTRRGCAAGRRRAPGARGPAGGARRRLQVRSTSNSSSLKSSSRSASSRSPRPVVPAGGGGAGWARGSSRTPPPRMSTREEGPCPLPWPFLLHVVPQIQGKSFLGSTLSPSWSLQIPA